MNDAKQLPDGLQPLPEGAYYAGTLADFDGRVNGWVSEGPNDEWKHGIWGGMKRFPNDDSADWHVALPIKDAPNQHDDGGPAFPVAGHTGENPELTAYGKLGHPGMTLRDWFAGMALQGLLHQRLESGDYQSVGSQVDKDDAGIVYKGSYITCDGDDESHHAAIDAYKFADAMLEVRKGVLP